MDPRTERIILVAMTLAERDGYEAVRLRDVAEQAEVALGTVYRRFSSKEDILAAVLNLQVTALRDTIEGGTDFGDTVEERLNRFCEQLVTFMAERPKLAAAMLRTVASGVPALVERVARYHDEMTESILMILRGGSPPGQEMAVEREELLARVVQDVLFASLVGWTGGLHDIEAVVAHMKATLEVLIRGAETG